MNSGFVVWFTGLSGAGKSTLAAMLSAELRARGVHVEVLDGDEVRTHLSKGLSFSKEDRDVNVRRIGFVAKLVARSGGCAMTAAISPYRAIRDEQRAQIGRFVEVYCRCDIPVLAERDAKGLYKKALAGEIKHFTGIDDPYEPPENPEVVVDTGAETKEASLARILAKLEELGYVERRHGGAGAKHLPAPHGGELVSRFALGAEREAIAARAAGLPVIDLDERGESDLLMLASGAYSPLKGFMNSKEYLRVVREMRLETGLVWPIPITLAIDEATSVGPEVALRGRDGRILAVLEVSDRWTPDKALEAREVYGTTDTAHPGVAYLMRSGSVYLGGEVHVIDRPALPVDAALCLDPRQTRAAFEARGFTTVVGFQTRSPLHRAHEHLTKSALETVDGLLLYPIVGATREGDFSAAVRMKTYEAVIDRYYARERVVLAACPAAMRFAGPREAIFHALVRKNHGCSHFIVGRDHAGFGAFYGPHDARRAFEAFAPGELGVEPLFFEDAFFSTATGEMATRKTAPPDARQIALSGTRVREMLARGEVPPPEAMRPEVSAILVEAMNRRV